MKQEDILNMPAGRKMDTLIWKHVYKSEHSKPPVNDFPSTDIASAWGVVDKLQIHTLRRVVNDEPDKPALWQVMVYADSAFSGIAETPELAICRAALLATMELVP